MITQPRQDRDDASMVLQPSHGGGGGSRRVGVPTPLGGIGRTFQDRFPNRDVLSEKKSSTLRRPCAVLPNRKGGHMTSIHTLPTISVGRSCPLSLNLQNNQSMRFITSATKPLTTTTTTTTTTTMERSLTDFVATLSNGHDDRSNNNNMPQHWVEAQLEQFVYHRAMSDHEWWMSSQHHYPTTTTRRRTSEGVEQMDEIVHAYIVSHDAKDIVPIMGEGTLSSILSSDGNPVRSLERQRQVRLLTLLTEFLYNQQVIGFRTMREFKTRLSSLAGSTVLFQQPDPISTPPSSADRILVDGEKIVHQLSVLKAGGYWKYLSRSGPEDVESEQYDLEDNTSSSYQQSCPSDNEEKENSRPACGNLHNVGGRGGPWTGRNVTILNPSWYGPDDDDDDDDEQHDDDDDDDGDNDTSTGSTMAEPSTTFLAGCVLSGGNVHSSTNNGFFVKKVTGDGWLCCRTISQSSDPTNSCADSIPTYLLRLPWKVAKLGCDGMSICGIDLRQRRDNGAIEPCNTTLVDDGFNDCSPLRGTIHL